MKKFQTYPYFFNSSFSFTESVLLEKKKSIYDDGKKIVYFNG